MWQEALHWLYQQSGGMALPGDDTCYLCGQSCAPGHVVKHAIAETFNSHWRAQCRSSNVLCAACAWYLDSKAGHPDYRKMSLVVQARTWRNWQRSEMKADIERWLTQGLEAASYLVVSLTKKKHLLLQAPLNAGGISSGLAIQVEERIAYASASSWQQIAAPFLALLTLGHGKSEILSGQLYAHTLRKHGRLSEVIRLSKQLDQWRDSALIELYSYVTIVEEKEQIQDDRRGDTDRTESGDAADRRSVSIAPGGLEIDQPGLQIAVPGRNLATIRGTYRHRQSDDSDTSGISQQTLWDAPHS